MSKIITISREFSSGGREIGKRLADELDIAYYDKEIVGEISKRTGLTKEYIEKFSEKSMTRVYPYAFRASFYTYTNSVVEEVHKIQAEVIRKLATQGDCVVVGRCSDYILREFDPFKVYVYSSNEKDKISRCENNSELTNEKDIIKQIHHIDKERAKYYYSYTGQKRGEVKNYNLLIDTSVVSIKTAVKLIATAVMEKD